ncbi:MAG TPA: hypothetical protein PL037_06975, partial [Elusimicrobiales bacterium]|nr:hypothetical protein [Elusimicrobiales bacterium]
TPTYYGIAHSTAVYPNANQYEAPAMRFYYETPPPVKDISVLRIAAVEYQVDAGAWQQASPRDSGFDSVVDSFTFTTTALSNAAHTIRARAKDNFGNYDPSPPSDALTVNNALPSDILHVYDGTTTAFDIDFTRNGGSLSANWSASSYMGGNPAYYEYRIGTTPGGAEVSGWTNVGVTTGVTRTGLSLTESATYYFAVRAAGLPGPFYSGVTVSDGQRVDVTSPTARVEISSTLPAKAGSLSLKLIVSEANGLLGTPALSFTTADGAGHSMALTYLANTSTWTASTYIESWYSTGTAVFSFSAVDTAGNRGAVITSGGSFQVDTAVSGAAGAVVSNSDAYSVTLPAGVYSGNLLVSISTVPASRTALADAARSESIPLKGSDLTREFTARSPSGALISGFLAPVTIKLCYPDADNDGRIDGDYIEESRTGLYWLDESSSRWTRVNGAQRLTASNCLSAQVSHFSVYSVRALDAAESGLGNVKAFPSPCYFDRSPGVLTVRGIPLDAVRPEIDIYNVAGELVRTLKPGDGIDPFYNDGLWDGRQSGGAKAASGLYVYVVRTGNYGKTTGKFYIFW